MVPSVAAGEACYERDRRSTGPIQAQDIPAHRRGEFTEDKIHYQITGLVCQR
jgi:hypothetical protein